MNDRPPRSCPYCYMPLDDPSLSICDSCIRAGFTAITLLKAVPAAVPEGTEA